jgi:hypothetical protein
MRCPLTKAVTANRVSSFRWQVAVEESLSRLMEGFSWQFLISSGKLPNAEWFD